MSDLARGLADEDGGSGATGADPILLIKLFVPAVRAGLVPRPALVARLKGGPRGKLTLVAAPAGFGKTTLITE
jgi:LuxR family maltose regulon positive regulatory protein